MLSAPGDQVYKTAKQIDPDLNVVVITGYPDSEILDRILQFSPVTVLKKPLKVEQLNQTVKILLHDGQSWRAEPTKFEASGGLVTWPLSKAHPFGDPRAKCSSSASPGRPQAFVVCNKFVHSFSVLLGLLPTVVSSGAI